MQAVFGWFQIPVLPWRLPAGPQEIRAACSGHRHSLRAWDESGGRQKWLFAVHRNLVSLLVPIQRRKGQKMALFLGQIRWIWSPRRPGEIRAETNDALGSFPAIPSGGPNSRFSPGAVIRSVVDASQESSVVHARAARSTTSSRSYPKPAPPFLGERTVGKRPRLNRPSGKRRECRRDP